MRVEKQYLISEVETHLKKSDYVILANFSKVTVSVVAELRNRLAAEKAEFHVVKNSSLRVAAKALGLPDVEGSLTGPTAVVVGGKNPAGVAKIADLPPFDALRAQFLGLLTSNAAAFVRVLDAKVKKEQPAAPATPDAPAAPAAPAA